MLPEQGHLAAFSGVRPDELQGHAVHQRAGARSEPRQATANTAVGTDPSASTSLVLWLTRPSTVPTMIPARTRAPTTSSRRCLMTPMATPAAGNTPASSKAVTADRPAERSRL